MYAQATTHSYMQALFETHNAIELEWKCQACDPIILTVGLIDNVMAADSAPSMFCAKKYVRSCTIHSCRHSLHSHRSGLLSIQVF